MIRCDAELVINRPVTEVFAFFSDFAALPSWQPEFSEVVRLDAGPLRTGSRFRYCRKLPIGRQRGTIELTAYAEDQSFSWRAIGGPVQPGGSMAFSTADGGTRVHERFQAEIRWPLKLLTPVLARQFRADVRADLAKAKRILEAGAVSGTEHVRSAP